MTECFGTEETTGCPTTKSITRNVMWDLHRPQNKLCAANKEVIMGMVNQGESGVGAVDVQWLRIFGPFWNNNIKASASSKNSKSINNWAQKLTDSKTKEIYANEKYNETLDWA